MREPGQPLDNADVERIISGELTAGREYVFGADNIAAERDRNYDYYRGIMSDLPAPPGRSRVVDMTVSNYIGMQIPQLMRVFTAGPNVVEYISPTEDLAPVVKLVTKFINGTVFRKDNRGEAIFRDWAQDSLVQKLGVAYWQWEPRWETKDEILENVPAQNLTPLAMEIQSQGAEIVEHSETAPGIHAVKIRTKVNKSFCRIDVMPPEEFVISRDARNFHEPVLRGHRTGVLVGDLVAAGIPFDDVKDLPAFTEGYQDRNTGKYNNQAGPNTLSSATDPMLKRVCVFRGILRCDYDGTGIKDWFVVTAGYDHAPKLLTIDAYAEQFGVAGFCSEPLAHTVYGTCPADRLANLQKIRTVITRLMNDNLFLAITPQREVVKDWIISPDQLANLSPGASILVKQPGAIREVAIPFVGDKALAGLEYYDLQAELTTGVSRTSAGLDPETLQNQSATASMNQYNAMMGRTEDVARIWAHGGMRDLFRGVWKCIRNFQDFPRMVQIEGESQTIDPATWAALGDLDLTVNTGLGTGSREKDFAYLTSLEADQEKTYQLLGPDNPIVTTKMIVRTKQLKAESMGIQNPEQFYKDPGEWKPPEPPPPQPTPDAVLNNETFKEIEFKKIESDERKKVADIASRERVDMTRIEADLMVKGEQLGIDRTKLVLEAVKIDAEQIANDMEAKKSDDAA